MPSFEEAFLVSKGQPVKFEGRVIQMVDRIPLKGPTQVRLFFESAKSNWRQGVHFSTVGNFEVNGLKLEKAVLLWEDTAPSEVLIQINSMDGLLLVKNVWDVGDGVVHSWHNGAAMIVEECVSMRRYYCNDGFPDDDFDDLIFSVSWSS